MTKNPVEIQTDDVYIQSKIDKVFLKDLIFPFETIHLPAYKPIYCTKKSLDGIIEKGGSISLALFKQKTIVGLAILDYPDEKVIWAHSNRESIMELKAVEVLREFRNRGIARQLMVRLFSDSFVEEKIIYLTAYSWIWDLAY
ncbi:MAG: GNAT family N-acetyltransferase, partial [Desulfobacula sp.]